MGRTRSLSIGRTLLAFLVILTVQVSSEGFKMDAPVESSTGASYVYPTTQTLGKIPDVSPCGVLYCEHNIIHENPNDQSKLLLMKIYKRDSDKVSSDLQKQDKIASYSRYSQAGDDKQDSITGEITDMGGHIRLELTKREDCLFRPYFCAAVIGNRGSVREAIFEVNVTNTSSAGQDLVTPPLASSKNGQEGDEDHTTSSAVLEKLRCIESRLSELFSQDSKLEDKVERLRYSVADKIGALEINVAEKLKYSDARINDKLEHLQERIEDKLSGVYVTSWWSRFGKTKGGFPCDVCGSIKAVESGIQSLDSTKFSSLGVRFDELEEAVRRSESATKTFYSKLDTIASGVNHITNIGQTLIRSNSALRSICKNGGQEPVDEYFDALGTGEKVWRLAFRGTAHNNVQIYPAYLYGTGIPAEVEPGCKQFSGANNSLPCINHYRNHQALDRWDNVEQVLFAVYVKGKMVEHVLFNGRGSTFTSWFGSNRVLESSWMDLKSLSHNYFSIEGDARPHLQWRFLINHRYHKCATDKGWFIAADVAPGYCGFEKKLALPAFFYAKDTTVATYSSDSAARADAIGIFIRYK